MQHEGNLLFQIARLGKLAEIALPELLEVR
jgi:hypothetical protein